jgi:hypothetical protein
MLVFRFESKRGADDRKLSTTEFFLTFLFRWTSSYPTELYMQLQWGRAGPLLLGFEIELGRYARYIYEYQDTYSSCRLLYIQFRNEACYILIE